MADSEPVIPNSPQGPLPLRRQSPDLNFCTSHQPIAVEGKETTTLDFFSLGGSQSIPSSVDVAPNVLQSSIITQNLLNPWQKTKGSSNILRIASVPGISKTHISSVEYSAGRQMPYIFVNEGVEMQPNHRSLDVSHVPKAYGPHDVSNNKHRQQQQKRRLSWVVSEDDDDEDDEFDPGYSSKKEIGYQKFDNSQQPEGRNMDIKELTPKSKHSATEQRRRSRINDRFQMLRQLLPYSDQKRDKASFLLEVIEHIQMLHEKVKKYEAAELLGQPQEKPKALHWDRASRCNEGVIDTSYGQAVMYNIKDNLDANGSVRHQSSPPRVGHRNVDAQIEQISNGMHASQYPHPLLQAPACLASYGHSIISTPAVLTFATSPVTYGEEPATPTLFPSSSQLLPEPRSMFAQLVRQEDLSHIMIQERNIPVTHSDSRTKDHELDGKLRWSPVKDIYESDIDPTSNECKVDKGRTALEAMQMDMNLKGSKRDPGRKVVVHNQAQRAVLRGSVTVSSPYSQGLLDSLTRALQRSGVDLSQASISVQIDLGRSSGSSSREIATLNTAMPPLPNSKLVRAEELELSITKKPKLEADT